MSVIVFKEWAPDAAPLGSEYLTECQNALPLDGVHKSFAPLTGSGTAAPTSLIGAICSSSILGGTYIGTLTNLYRLIPGASSYTMLSAATYNATSDDYWRFVQYETLMIATNGVDLPQAHTVGSNGNFSALGTSGTAPAARHVGVIGQFVMIGDLTDAASTTRPYTVQWCSIDQPRNWPTPGSSTAIASQAGEQILNPSFGSVMGIYGNDQYGVIFQQGGITRATYVGGTTVFQFDEYEYGRGLLFPNSAIQIGNVTYYISPAGFCATDGVSVRNIGANKVDNYFKSQVNHIYKPKVRSAADFGRELIYWDYVSTTSGGAQADQFLAYNWQEDRWSRASQTHEMIISPRHTISAGEAAQRVVGWQSSRTIGSLNGTPGTAVFDSGEAELHEGGFTYVSGVKPLVDQSSVTVQLGYRTEQSASPTYTAAVVPTSRTGYADFRQDSRYFRTRVSVAGTFNSMQGVAFNASKGGKT